jgi:NAD(P)H-dependent FMN reductase
MDLAFLPFRRLNPLKNNGFNSRKAMNSFVFSAFKYNNCKKSYKFHAFFLCHLCIRFNPFDYISPSEHKYIINMKSRKMPHISIIPAFEMYAYQNDCALTYINNYLQQQHLASTDIIDPESFNFKMFKGDGRAKPGKGMKKLIKKIRSSAGILIVTPEFNGEYPEYLKQIIDFLYDEWDHKPVAISTVSDHGEDCAQTIKSLQFSLWKINSWMVPVSFSVPEIIATQSSDTNVQSLQASAQPATEKEFREVLNNYCHKYIQLCTKVKYAV